MLFSIVMIVGTPLIVICLGVSIFLLSYSSSVVVTLNSRSEVITKYNEIAILWNSIGYPLMKESNFQLNIQETSFTFQHSNTEYGLYWPVRDSCQHENDPSIGCIPVKNDHLTLPPIVVSGESQVSLVNPNGDILLNYVLPMTKISILSADSLHCFSESSCTEECTKINGKWENNSCTVTSYLTSVCYRIRKNDQNNFIIDYADASLNPEQRVYIRPDAGCLYNNGTWSPFIYTNTPVSSVSFSLRHEYDPYSAASGLTKGCNEQPFQENCFDNSNVQVSQKNVGLFYTGVAFLIVSCVLLLSVIVMLVLTKIVHIKTNKTKKAPERRNSSVNVKGKIRKDSLTYVNLEQNKHTHVDETSKTIRV
ncbi:hypothetical protein WA158_002006 [Blastocystis sp. Blastoise]